MASRKPLVVTEGQLQQLQSGDELDIPLDERVRVLELALSLLVGHLLALGLEPPAAVIELLPAVTT